MRRASSVVQRLTFSTKRHSRDNWFGARLWAERDPLEDQADVALARAGVKAAGGGACDELAGGGREREREREKERKRETERLAFETDQSHTHSLQVHKRNPDKLASSPPRRGRAHFRIQQDGAFRAASGEKTAKNEIKWKGKQQRGRALTARSSYLLAANAGNGGQTIVKHPLFGGGRRKAPPGAMTTRVGGLLKQPEGMREPFSRVKL